MPEIIKILVARKTKSDVDLLCHVQESLITACLLNIITKSLQDPKYFL